jgi:hypothetical protein
MDTILTHILNKDFVKLSSSIHEELNKKIANMIFQEGYSIRNTDEEDTFDIVLKRDSDSSPKLVKRVKGSKEKAIEELRKIRESHKELSNAQ